MYRNGKWRNRGKGRLLGWLGTAGTVLAVVLSACSPAPAASAGQPASSGATAPPAAGSPGVATSGKAAPPAGVQAIALYNAADRQQVLEAGARKEGKLSFYTSLTTPINDALIAGFKKKYPFLSVEVYRGDQASLVTKATEEAQANQPSFDVIEANPVVVSTLAQDKLLTRYASPSLADVPPAYLSGAANGSVDTAIDRVQYVSFAYNTKLLPASAVPKSLSDLASPALSGKLALPGSSTGPTWVGLILHVMGQQKGQAFLQQFAAQQHVQVQEVSATSLMDLIAKGEVAASPAIYESDTLRMASDQKAPVKWVPLQPVIGAPGQVGVAAKAPHPYAAMLWVDYLFGDGEQVFTKLNMHPPHEKGATPPQFWNNWDGLTATQMQDQSKQWTTLFKSLFRKGA